MSAFFVLGDVRRSQVLREWSRETARSERGTADRTSGNRFPAAANRPRTPTAGRGSQRGYAVDHAARGNRRPESQSNLAVSWRRRRATVNHDNSVSIDRQDDVRRGQIQYLNKGDNRHGNFTSKLLS